ncbi:DUF2059 domain-containing protein [Aureisphaera galaxeae]|uniref:DUF2059 domain-containing protein n=1 Tax=Aureisphaera galaxeae TaxID=1538023 RepID=UPI002350AFE7|nr:DUF2059 domain-containing protein [Aureisphaera galaxeae]MDC8004475.1 DUF2059 domain-containing protein [Aureisphaera galaxeae]
MTICFSLQAQVDDYQQDIINYLSINGTYEQYSAAYDDMFTVLKKQFETANVPESKWKELKEDKNKSLEEVVRFLSFAYRKHFTQDEIKKMYEVYNSKAAQEMLAKQGTLTRNEDKEVDAFFESDLGKKIVAKRSELSEDIGEISGHWSRDLFAAKMSNLVKSGYIPQR